MPVDEHTYAERKEEQKNTEQGGNKTRGLWANDDNCTTHQCKTADKLYREFLDGGLGRGPCSMAENRGKDAGGE